MLAAAKTRWRLVAVGLVALLLAGFLVAVYLAPATSNALSVKLEGSGVVGTKARFVLTARGSPYPHWGGVRVLELAASASRPVYLSLEGLFRSFEITAGPAQDNPWGRASIWNLTGIDLSFGRTFTLDVVPVWAAEIPLRAIVWSPLSRLADVQFINGDMVDSATVSLEYLVTVKVTTAWPLLGSLAPDTALVLGQATPMHAGVLEWAQGPSPSTPLFLSIVTKPMYFALATDGSDVNPWNLTACWNVTGLGLFRILEVTFTATPMMAEKGVPIGIRVWSPRGTLSAVHVSSDGELIVDDAVRLWMDTSFSFSVSVP